jgi:hypothetical protein
MWRVMAGADGFAHGLVEERGDDASVQKAVRAFEGVRDRW